MNLLKKCIAEFLGTFAIVFGGCGAVTANQISSGAVSHLGVATSFGLIVLVMIYTFGHISGAHFNPAVTLAFAVKKHFPIKEIAPYLLSQIGGAIAGALILLTTLKAPSETLNLGVTQPYDGIFFTAFIWEFLLTMFLMLVIMSVATDYRAQGQLAGLAIGCTIWFEAIFGGPVCGASMNPARSIGPAIVSGKMDFLLAYILGPIAGAICGAIIYDFLRCSPSEKEKVKGCC